MVPWIRELSSFGRTRFQLDQNVECHCSALLQCHHLAFGERWAYDRGIGLALVMQHHTLASCCWTLKFGPPPLASRLSASGILADAPCAAPRLLCRCHSPSIGPLLFPGYGMPLLSGLMLRTRLRKTRQFTLHDSTANVQRAGVHVCVCVCADNVGLSLSSRLRHHVDCGS